MLIIIILTTTAVTEVYVDHHANLEDFAENEKCLHPSRPSRPAYGRASRLGPPGRNDSRHVDSGHVEYHHSRTEGDA